MTFSERNIFFKIKIAFCSIIAFLMLAGSFSVIPLYPSMPESISIGENAASNRPNDIFQLFFSLFLKADYLAVHCSIILCVLYSFLAIILIHYFFEQTSAPEIFYVAIFTISFSFEIIRIILPLQLIHSIPSFYLLISARILLFFRFFGIFSLFAAGICAAGLEDQKTSTIILVIATAALIIAFSVPINTQIWDTSLNMAVGSTFMFRLVEVTVFLVTIISFFVAVNVRGSKDYFNVGIGVGLALIGRTLLHNADNWVSPILGITLLSLGTYYICSKLHKIHLWL